MQTRSTTPRDSWEYSLKLPHCAIGSGVARSTVRSILLRHALPEFIDTAELLTSELCSNAYRYAGGPATVSIRWRDGTLHVSVWDSNTALPRPQAGSQSHDRGRGLLLVSRCAHAWGSRAAHPGKVTWFELRE